MNYNIPKTKKIIFYIIWAIILFYLYSKFADMHPFGKNSVFYKSGCKASKANIPKKPLKFEGFVK